ncbi:multi-sensor hybrid histidine kinase [Methylobacter tundripaludum SV96]|uniref:histidine kinase n=2 Tax=Methylobacter tundripaludum TaxID=173365 RepID=G3IVG7_METTV|nr:multi-sensor hybrid histidine kinase [Methylobacter tundripaludum SV96]
MATVGNSYRSHALRGNAVQDAPASRNAGALLTEFPRRSVGTIVILIFALCGLAHADNALEQWRSKAGEIRMLAENDTQRAYAEAERLQADFPAYASPADRARLLNLLARIEIYQAQTEKAAAHIQHAMELAKQHNDPVGQAEADLNTTLNAINQARVDDAIAASIHGLAVLDGVDRPDLLGEALLRMAMMYRRTDQLDESITMSMQSLDIARQSNNPLALVYAYHGLAIAYELSDHFSEAGEYYQRMLEQARIAGSRLMEAYALLGLGYTHNNRGDLKSAEPLIREAVAVFHAIDVPFSVNFSQFALADNLRKQQRYAETLPIFDEVIERYQRYPNKIGLWWVLNARSTHQMALGHIADAHRDVEQAYKLAKEIGVPLYLTDSAKRLAEIAAAKGDYRQAYRFMFDASDTAAKAAKDTAATRMLQLTRRYQTESKQREIDKLNRRNQQQAAELKHRTLEQRWLWTVLGGSVIMLTGAAFFLVRLRRSHRRLEALNTQVLQAKNKLQATLDTIPDLLFEIGLDGRYYDYHSPCTELLLVPAEDLLGKTVSDVMPAEAAKIVMSALREAHDQGISTGKQFQLPLPHGDFWFELSVAIKPTLDKEEAHLIVLSRNITERKHMEAQVLQREQEFRVLVENSPDLIFRYDKECRRIYTNPAVARLVGRRADALLNMSPSEAKILSAGEADKLMQMIRQVQATGRPAESEVECLGADGQLHYFHNRYAPEFNAHGEVVGVISIARDVTERKQAAEALAASEREFRTLAESLPDNIVRYDLEGRVIYVNPVLEKTLGTIVSKMLGTTVRERFPNGEYDDYAQLLDAVLTSGEIGEIEKIVTPPYSNLHLVHSIRMIAECDENGEVIGVLAIGRDITERKLAEQALRESEEKYRTLIQKIQAAVVVHGADTQILTFNLVAQEILGLSEDQLYGKTAIDPVWHFFHENGCAASPDEYPVNKVLASGKALKNYVLGVHRPGRQQDVWVLVNADPVFGKDGKITQVIITFIDITQRKQAEQRLWLVDFALNQVREAVYIINLQDHRFLNVNAEASRALGYSTEELLDLTIYDIDPDADSEGMENLQREIDAGSLSVFERRHKTKDGRIFPVEINAQVFEYEGRPTSIALVRDITERKRVEDEVRALNADLELRVLERTEALRLQTRYLRTLIDTLPMLAWLKDKESRFLVVNQTMALACTLSVDEMVGKSDLDCWPREYAESYRAVDSEVMATGRRKTVEGPFFDAHDGVIWVETFKAPVLDVDGSVLGTVGIALDISDRRALEMAREAALAEAERLARLRSEFMARMSHELRTPLNGILGYAQILLGESRGNERQSAMLNVIQQSGEYLLNLINDILDFAKIEAGKQELSLSDIQLPSFLRNLASIITIKAEQKALVFVCDIAADVPAGIRADETRLRQVLLNLLSNAIKYSERGQISLKVTVLEPGRLRFEVQDSGLGIDTGQLDTIFQAFEQAGDWQHRTGGTGLGLPISRELVRMMDSDIHVTSRVDEGSTFWFDLDVTVVEVCDDIMVAEQHIVGYQGLRRRVLVVDDANENRTLLIDILGRLGFETFEAANGRACLDSVEAQTPDLILLDMVMPEMDGLETTRRLRCMQGFGQTPIIAVSASASGSDVTEAMKAGVNVFLSKPIDIKRLMVQIAVLLKLDWIYALPEADAPLRQRLNEALVVPPLEEMAILHRLAQEGSMRDIILQTTYLEGLDQSYRPFAAQLRALAQDYQSKAILDLVEGYIDSIVTTQRSQWNADAKSRRL